MLPEKSAAVIPAVVSLLIQAGKGDFSRKNRRVTFFPAIFSYVVSLPVRADKKFRNNKILK
ncbi:hypothetical protein [Cronobacter malonaticus]|uniref:hypothetical protein n=1 Tax=Cronobacter malonaticus TaxID=413503 RepID=UPI000907B8F6|nr:hypothetical protein [Cronobacter malonaticus]EGT4372555.1 hypothetical protein [Cronobacter malonaticus]HAU5445986.1 hypothetical protein [Cronobacter malonaticus]